MSRFKELARIQAAIKHKDESELRWADWYCRMRQQVATRKHHTQYWREMQSKVAAVLREIEPSSDSKNAAKGKWEHWQKFVSVETPSIRKSHKRHEAGLCVGCGKKPCECKRPRSKKPVAG
jgi:hypothetical protein